tara:strand:+ start:140 stop:1126 length:987 start_codon:yes stop_codon:yes gene_type:complete
MNYDKIVEMDIDTIIEKLEVKTPRICVIGDIILDQYIWSDVSRISPEAPVPVCHVQKTSEGLGGAGNVARNLKHFGADVTLGSILGNDAYGQKVQKIITNENIDGKNIQYEDDVATICKVRVIASNQQVCRIDYENTRDIEKKSMDLIDQVVDTVGLFDVMVLSDYNKGVISEALSQAVIQEAQKHGVPVIIDPKGVNVSKYKGAHYITPNVAEFKLLTNQHILDSEDQIQAAAIELIEAYNIENVVLTRSQKGISVISKEKKVDISTKVKDVIDVSGAGDTVIAGVAFGLALNLDQQACIEFSNQAAGVVVSKVGAETATLEEMKNI